MSEPLFTNHTQSTGTQTLGQPYAPSGFPEQGRHQGQGSYDQSPFGQTSYEAAQVHPQQGVPPGSFSPEPPRSTPGSFVQSLPPRGRQVLAVLALLTVGLGGFGFVTHNGLASAQDKAHGLSESLDKTKDSLGAKQAELEKTQQQLSSLQESSDGTAAALDSMTTCASLLQSAWTKYFAEDFDGAATDLESSHETCDAALPQSGASQ